MERTYNLDQFLTVENMIRLVEDNGLKVNNDIPPELFETLEYYRNHLITCPNTPYILDNGQEYRLKIDVGLKNEYYIMGWNLKKLQYVIKRENFKKTIITPDLLKKSIRNFSKEVPVGKSDLNESSEPILLSYPPIKSKFLVVKGENILLNHIRESKPVEVYYIPIHLHLQATTNPIFRSLFNIHFNYSLLCSYLANQINMEEVERRILPVI
ncbi:MAG: hypothetical protein ACO1OT_09250 [Heyndrickxia sp.]|jgi:hypothetical protein